MNIQEETLILVRLQKEKLKLNCMKNKQSHTLSQDTPLHFGYLAGMGCRDATEMRAKEFVAHFSNEQYGTSY